MAKLPGSIETARKYAGLRTGPDENTFLDGSGRCTPPADATCQNISIPRQISKWRRKTMGALLPVGSGPDAEIVDRLNNLFSGTNLAVLRNHHRRKEKLFHGAHRLRRV